MYLGLFILLHFIFSLRIYFSEKIYGVKSIYVLGLILFVFIPTLYNRLSLVYVNYEPSWLFHLTLFVCSTVVYFIKISYAKVGLLFEVSFKRKIITKVSILLWAVFLFILILTFVGFDYLLRFPSVGFYIITSYFTIYLLKKRTEYGNSFINFGLMSFLILLLFAFFLWTGSGRLILFQFVSIALFLFTWTLKSPQKIKILFLLFVPILIFVGGALRDDSAGFTETLTSGGGAGSMFSTYRESERVFNDVSSGNRQILMGESYVAGFLFFVPRIYWESKPVGFGYQLVEWYEPWQLGKGHSLAASFIAEAYANFHLLGLLLCPLLIFLIIKWLSYCFSKPVKQFSSNDIKIILVGLCFFCCILEFIWGGIQTFLIRSVVSSLAVILIFKYLKFFGAFRS